MSEPRQYVAGDDPDEGWQPTPEQVDQQSHWEAQAEEACAPEGAYLPIKHADADGEPQF